MTLQLKYSQETVQSGFQNPNENSNWKKFLKFLLLIRRKLKEISKIFQTKF